MDWAAMEFRAASPADVVEEGDVIPTAGQKRGRLKLWCDECRDWFTPAMPYDGRCPRCGSRVIKMKCTRCGGEWYMRDPSRMPETCTKCKSPYYNRERMKDRRDARVEQCAKCGRRTRSVVWFGREGAEAPLCKGCADVAERLFDDYLSREGQALYLALTPDQVESMRAFFRGRRRYEGHKMREMRGGGPLRQ